MWMPNKKELLVPFCIEFSIHTAKYAWLLKSQESHKIVCLRRKSSLFSFFPYKHRKSQKKIPHSMVSKPAVRLRLVFATNKRETNNLTHAPCEMLMHTVLHCWFFFISCAPYQEFLRNWTTTKFCVLFACIHIFGNWTCGKQKNVPARINRRKTQ